MNIISSLLNLSEIEVVHQIERMHAYPPPFYRLANILEKRPEFIVIHRLENIFFTSIDTSKFSYDSKNIFIFLSLVTLLLIFSRYLGDQKKH